MKQILITDSLFIFPEHEQRLRDAGYEVERLDKPKASEAELAEAIKGKTAYILGGIEQITKTVIDAADELKAIVFTGIDYRGFIPAWEHATKKGIAIANVPDGPTHAVAEWSIAATLMMTRGMLDLARTGEKTFLTTSGLEGQTIGIIALGRIGTRIAEMLQVFRPDQILYYSTHRHEAQEQSLGLRYAEMNDLLQQSDVVFLGVPVAAGQDFFSYDQFAHMKDGALLITFVHEDTINASALYEALKAGKIRAASDHPMGERFNEFPLSVWYSFQASNAFNTQPSLEYTSGEATQSLINLLATGTDKNRVN